MDNKLIKGHGVATGLVNVYAVAKLSVKYNDLDAVGFYWVDIHLANTSTTVTLDLGGGVKSVKTSVGGSSIPVGRIQVRRHLFFYDGTDAILLDADVEAELTSLANDISTLTTEIAAVESGQDIKQDVVTSSYGEGDLDLTGEETLNGVTTVTSRVLVTDQTDPSENGIYITAAGAWTRATDYNDTPDGEISNGNTIYVNSSAPGSHTGSSTKDNFKYILVSQGPFTIDVTDLNFVEHHHASKYTYSFSGGAEDADHTAPSQVYSDYMPYALEVKNVIITLVLDAEDSGSALFTVDIRRNGVTIFNGVLPTIDDGEFTSLNADTAAVLKTNGDQNFAAGDHITAHVTVIGDTDPGQGLKVHVDGLRL